LKFRVTLLLFHPAALGAGEALTVTTGGVLSIFRTAFVVAVLPALSVAVPLTA
jgi:hypothetical protein